MVDGLLVGMGVLVAVLAVVAYQRGGSDLLLEGFRGGGGLLWRYSLLLAVSFMLAGFAEVLIPHRWVAETLGAESGVRGLLLGAAAGAVTPAGPFVAMPIAAVLIRSGASQAAVVAFVTSWSLLAVHRFVAWEVPILGMRFALLRYGVCLLLPIVAGLAARAFAR